MVLRVDADFEKGSDRLSCGTPNPSVEAIDHMRAKGEWMHWYNEKRGCGEILVFSRVAYIYHVVLIINVVAGHGKATILGEPIIPVPKIGTWTRESEPMSVRAMKRQSIQYKI